MSGGGPGAFGSGGDALALGFYFGERDRHGGESLADAVLDLFARRGVAAGALLRGAEGFGAAQRLRDDQRLSLSEDLPLLALAYDRREAIEPLAAELAAIGGDGLLTLERARFAGATRRPEDEPHEEVKLTVIVGRRERRGGVSAHVNVVAKLHRHGVAGATALLAVDGAAAGRRLRARFLAGNGWVPALVVAVGERGRIAAVLAELAEEDEPPLTILEAVRVLRRDGEQLAEPPAPPGGEGDDGPWWKLSIYCSQSSEVEGRQLHAELIRRLRAEGAAGATALRGVWGYHGEHEPHGDRMLRLRRRVPIVVTVIDRPGRARRWLEIATELTAETGLLTLETVPVAEIRGPNGHREGGLRL